MTPHRMAATATTTITMATGTKTAAGDCGTSDRNITTELFSGDRNNKNDDDKSKGKNSNHSHNKTENESEKNMKINDSSERFNTLSPN
ncbi:Hypothetical predicted protein [Octopus vulgaris]|uniref:Uncharacterized protein n=1 Tax=Octopus vulgaris TaxID=6645 RepID=A0AA36ANA6_OCTVU|nr:Hypothetical predicted protein [Octopus vulgaris]